MDDKAVLPTLPTFAAVDRAELLAGLGFIEGVATGARHEDILRWLASAAPRFAWPGPPLSVGEPNVGAFLLATAAASAALPQLAVAARDAVVRTLRAFLAGDDRFLQAAIFTGRVRRDSVTSTWVARPREADALSDVVLSLFVADILAYRAFYDQTLCVCEACGRVSFNPRITTRLGCIEHLAGRDAPTSAVRRSSIPDSTPPAITWSTR
jgi:hypothetical protein